MSETSLKGIPGILRPFREYLEKSNLPEGSEVVFLGIPGTCTPFVELLCYAVRSLPLRYIFVPNNLVDKASLLEYQEDVGFQAIQKVNINNPSVVVIMGGLSMPGVSVTKDQILSCINQWPQTPLVGVCFMHMFEKSGWLETFSFDLLIDADVSVDVTRR